MSACFLVKPTNNLRGHRGHIAAEDKYVPIEVGQCIRRTHHGMGRAQLFCLHDGFNGRTGKCGAKIILHGIPLMTQNQNHPLGI